MTAKLEDFFIFIFFLKKEENIAINVFNISFSSTHTS